jgi:hypothetical protein
MLPYGVTIQATVLQRAEIPEELINYPVYDLSVIYQFLYSINTTLQYGFLHKHYKCKYVCCFKYVWSGETRL